MAVELTDRSLSREKAPPRKPLSRKPPSRIERIRTGSGRELLLHGVAAVTPQALLVAFTPYLARVLGLAGFGVWTLCAAVMAILIALDGGLGSAMLRFLAVYEGAGREDDARRLLSVALIVWALLAAILFCGVYALAGSIAGLLHTADAARATALTSLRVLGAVAVLRILFSVVVAPLRARSRYGLVAAAVCMGAAVFTTVALFGPGEPDDVTTYVWALVAQWGTVDVLLIAAAAKSGVRLAAALPVRTDLREVWSFAWTGQLSAVAALVNLQTDAIVIGAFLPVTSLGVYGVASTVAAAFRSVPMLPLLPVSARFGIHFGRGGYAALEGIYQRTNRIWLRGLGIYSALGIPAAVTLAMLFVPRRHAQAGSLTLILVASYTVELLVAVGVVYLYSAGRPQVAARVALVAVVVNICLTVPFAILFHLIGVVTATAIGEVAGAVYGLAAIRRYRGGVESRERTAGT